VSEAVDFSVYVRRDGASAHMELAVEGVACAGCIRKIENGLRQISGIVDARLNFTNRRLAVEWQNGAIEPAGVIRASAFVPIPSSRHAPEPKNSARPGRC
jgi:P-type Cu2+ transporter